MSCNDLYEVNSLKKLLRRFDIMADKTKGQHFLADKRSLETIAEAAGSGGIAVEVGAGPGSLTCLLKGKFNRTYAIEVDESFRRLFTELNPERSVEFVEADFLSLDLSELGLEKKGTARLVGNIPYNITGKIVERAVEEREYFSKAVFTLQKEVADRIISDPGTKGCGPITYFVRAYAEVNKLTDLAPDAFYPPPEVDSSVIEIVYAPEKKFVSDEEALFSVIQGLFNYRRKTIRNGLLVSPNFSLTREVADAVIEEAGIDARKRPEELTLENFDRLTELLADRVNS
ncbi:MAG: 16S rRNA (adenine(1518)-N(6)/adenine(1519)-N(6))-dimethyltransferase RsmA [Candidatus Bipolaricaulia bacterium]